MGGGALGRLSGPQLALPSGHFSLVETEAQVRQSLGSGPGSMRCLGLAHGEAGAPWRDPVREPGPRCALCSWGPSPTALPSPGAPGDLLGQPLLSSVGHHGSPAVPPHARDPCHPGPVRGVGERWEPRWVASVKHGLGFQDSVPRDGQVTH